GEDISKIVNPKDPGEAGEGDGTALSTGKDEKTDTTGKKDGKDKKKGRGIGRKITMIDDEQVVMTVPKGTKPEQIVGKAVYDMTNFDLNAGILQFTYNDTPIGKIGVHFESFEASVRSALEQARKAWAEKRANKQ
ncbi:MAG: hypothetical protein IKG55_08975, partial [Solobacterium sp.]|nr:hypothetical protein [Solobacterium sp.]